MEKEQLIKVDVAGKVVFWIINSADFKNKHN